MPGKAGKEKEAITPLVPAAVIFLVFGVDRITKMLVVKGLTEGDSVPLTFFLHLTRVNNSGAAFGLWKGSSPFLIVISFLCIVFLSAMIWRGHFRRPADYAAPLIVAGALGNLADRLYYGYVVDFIDLGIWPVFNIADASITAGVLLILWRLMHPACVWRGR